MKVVIIIHTYYTCIFSVALFTAVLNAVIYLHVRKWVNHSVRVEMCESRGGRPGLSVLTSLLVSVDVKIYCTVLRHWSQLVPNISADI